MRNPWTIANPFNPGQKVTIPAGTVVHSTAPGRDVKVSGRTTTVRVNHVHDGWVSELTDYGPRGTCVLPVITWAGSGGYWHNAQVTPELLEANGLPILAAPDLSPDRRRLLKVAPDPHGPHTDRWPVPVPSA